MCIFGGNVLEGKEGSWGTRMMNEEAALYCCLALADGRRNREFARMQVCQDSRRREREKEEKMVK